MSTVIAALPQIIEGLSKVISNVNDLIKNKQTSTDKVKTQNDELTKNFNNLKTSLQNTGISMRDYVDIYAVAIEEEAAAESLDDMCDVWKEGKVGDGAISKGLRKLRTLDKKLKEVIDDNKAEIENDDYQAIKDTRAEIERLLDNAEALVDKKTPESRDAASKVITTISEKVGDVTSVPTQRFKAMSKTLIQATK